MDFNQIRYFLALADTLNFTRAADQCYISQPALTQAIKRLERELGGQLINRNGVHTELTKLGKTIRSHFEQIERAKRLVNSSAKAIVTGETAKLNIGVMCTIGPRLLTELLDSFQMDNAKVIFALHDVTPGAVSSMLLSGALDCAFCTKIDSPDSNLQYTSLYEEDMVVAFAPGHTFEKMDSVPLQAIDKYRYIDRLHCESRYKFMELCQDNAIDLNVVCCSQREDWIQCMIREDVGISVLPRYSVLQPGIDVRPIGNPNMSRTVQLATLTEPGNITMLDNFINYTANFNWQHPDR